MLDKFVVLCYTEDSMCGQFATHKDSLSYYNTVSELCGEYTADL